MLSKKLMYSSDILSYFMASIIVFSTINVKIVYSNGCEVTNHQILYWNLCLGMYRRTGFAFNANSMQLRWKKSKSRALIMLMR